MNYTIDSQGRAVIRVPKSQVAMYLAAPEIYKVLKAIGAEWVAQGGKVTELSPTCYHKAIEAIANIRRAEGIDDKQ